ncbi:MAG: thiamine phosphate synthase [Proteobacteria bacterium]|nr:thiamine phosphate synthase [Pseudomonadota bacterium]
MHPARPLRGLYAITDGPRADLADACAAAIRGGVAIIQYRDKTTAAARRHAEASTLADLCARHGTPLIVNDDVELAATVGAAGVHLGEDDPAIAIARAQLGAAAIIGVSCYDSLERARELAAAGADYLAFGSFFASRTKPHRRRADPDLLRAARAFGKPLVAIGGITPDNAAALIAAGADFVAAISGVFAQADIAAATRRYADLFCK